MSDEVIDETVDQRQAWLEERRKGIGGSDAACVLGANPYKTNVELWEEKTGRRDYEDLSGNTAVAYGVAAEPYLRDLFALHFKERYTVEYDAFGMIANNKQVPFAFATLDGKLCDIESGKVGILEIKTSEPRNSHEWSKWKNGVPQHYYVQILHQLMATGYEFAVLCAELKNSINGSYRIEHYLFERYTFEHEIEVLKQAEIRFWECVKSNIEPCRILPEI